MMCSRCSRLVVRKNRYSARSGRAPGVRGAAVLATLHRGGCARSAARIGLHRQRGDRGTRRVEAWRDQVEAGHEGPRRCGDPARLHARSPQANPVGLGVRESPERLEDPESARPGCGMVRAMTRALQWSLELRFNQDGWYRSITAALADRLRELPCWSLFTYLRQRGKRGVELTPAALEKAMTDDQTRDWRASVSEYGVDALFELGRDATTLTLRLTLQDDLIAAYAPALEGVTAAMLEALPEGVVLPMSGIRPRHSPDLPWDKIPDRPAAPYLRYENVVDMFDRRQSRVLPNPEANEVVARLLAAPPPPGVRRVDSANAALMFWTDRLSDDDALAAARMRHERHLTEVVRNVKAPPVAPPGDVQISVGPLHEHPPLSFLDPGQRIGFKTVVVFPDGSLQEGWDAAAEVARAGSLPGFGPLKAVYVIVPLREQAVALRARAEASGFAGVLYPGRPGELWRPGTNTP